MKKFCLVVALILVSLTSCNDDEQGLSETNSDTKWWVLTRTGTNNVGDREIVLYNETQDLIEKTLSLPSQIDSPHALEFDGEFLWLGGMGANESIYKLDSTDGSIVAELPNIRTEGISYDNGTLYYTSYGRIYQISENGSPIQEITLSDANIPTDIATYNAKIYFTYNGASDPIIKIAPTNLLEENFVETQVSALYTLTIHKEQLIVMTNANEIRRFDLYSGQKISDSSTPITGWVTAISPFYKE